MDGTFHPRFDMPSWVPNFRKFVVSEDRQFITIYNPHGLGETVARAHFERCIGYSAELRSSNSAEHDDLKPLGYDLIAAVMLLSGSLKGMLTLRSNTANAADGCRWGKKLPPLTVVDVFGELPETDDHVLTGREYKLFHALMQDKLEHILTREGKMTPMNSKKRSAGSAGISHDTPKSKRGKKSQSNSSPSPSKSENRNNHQKGKPKAKTGGQVKPMQDVVMQAPPLGAVRAAKPGPSPFVRDTAGSGSSKTLDGYFSKGEATMEAEAMAEMVKNAELIPLPLSEDEDDDSGDEDGMDMTG
ncbi:hypothetical protein C8J56DRAFT_891529 [Mycena floridula]|nr:hypothetical protein C8J56DRAFT_891529 [Mycena floridula]